MTAPKPDCKHLTAHELGKVNVGEEHVALHMSASGAKPRNHCQEAFTSLVWCAPIRLAGSLSMVALQA